MKKFCYFSVFSRTGQKIAFRQAKSIKEAGFDVTLLFCDGLPDDVIDGIKVRSIPIKTSIGHYFKRLMLFPFFLVKILKEINADVYMCCDVDSLLLCLFLKKNKKKVIFNLLEEHPYTLYDKIHANSYVKKFIVYITAKWMQLALKRVDKVYTVAPSIVDYLSKWGIRDVEILGNYPNVSKEHNLTYDEYVSREDRIIYFGAIYKISRQEHFFDALNSYPKVSYLLAGDFGVGNYHEQLKKHPYWKRVEFINKFHMTELSNMLSRSTISNVVRDFEETGYKTGSYGIIKLFESMEAGLPIICSDVQVYRDIFKEYPCGILVNPNSTEDIRVAINYLITNKKEAYLMGQNGRKAVIEKYNWNKESEKLISIVNKLAKS